ncbi:TPA: hypothetical protein ACLFOO_004248 [Yersinia enterocolitica]|nr:MULTISPECIES: hypothetical protein [Yersinia]EKN4025275.1 hypothetical protein [Yersinia enterocolitica]AYW88973.1 hypothetical protein EGX87_18325 [Yersinia pseudotuberculosis]AYW99721.1 hypothetical protein EGX53_07470 [Yersinia pseudotuberculosis]AZA31284.1 hypothetical protein DN756_15455 [Yersinia pseudotuberculosis]ELI7908497.1 hypothetical protein [Yersinia enterocolitica]
MSELLSLKLVINGTSPSEIPMNKLAGYLADLAALYGEEKDVRFESVTDGCVEIHTYTTNAVAHNVICANILENLEASKLARRISKDNFSAEIYSNNNLLSSIRSVTDEKPILITKKNSKIQGELYHIVEKANDSVSVRLRGNGGEILICTATKPDAVRLAKYLFKKIRVYGESQHEKKDGVWKLKNLKIEKFVELQDTKISEGLDRLSSDPANKWDEIENQGELILKYRSFS